MEYSRELDAEAVTLFENTMSLYGSAERIITSERGILLSDRDEIAGFGFGPNKGTWGFDLDALLAVKEQIESLSQRICTEMLIPGAPFGRLYLKELLGSSTDMVISSMVVSGLWHVRTWIDTRDDLEIVPLPPEGHVPFSYWVEEEEIEEEEIIDDFDFDLVVARWMESR